METLYRKYRPQKFSEIIGQKHITQTLSNSVKNGRIGHAYLFTGPRGTGKTAIARIFAKAVNCTNLSGGEPCLKCPICKNISDGRSLDIIEIDAASHTGVDNIRELRETVKLPPTQAKYKIYIIDEAHMLSTGAWNALLKTLEEPPSHVIFILATTEIHKVPETIISRCQRFDFTRLSLENIIKKLSAIAKSEKVKIEKEALEMIAIAAEGGMRDAESLLAQVISLEDKNITAKEVKEILGTTDYQSVKVIAGYLLEKNARKTLELINKLSEDGYDIEIFNKSLLNYLRHLMIISVDEKLSENFSFELTSEQISEMKKEARTRKASEILKIVDLLSEVQNEIKYSFIPQLPLELAIVKLAEKIPATDPKIPENQTPTETKINFPENKTPAAQKAEKIETENLPISESGNELSEISLYDVEKSWKNLLLEIKPFNHSLTAFLSNCQPFKISGKTIQIATPYKLYKDKLNEAKNKLTIEKGVAKITGIALRVAFLTEEEAGIKISKNHRASNMEHGTKNKSVSDSPAKNPSLLDDALKIMGGKVVDE